MSAMCTLLCKLSVLLYCLVITNSATIFVSRTGYDAISCGLTKNTSCGTLYFASTLLDQSNTEIYVINGQNEANINHSIYTLNDSLPYHPCLIKPLDHYGTTITITFSGEHIKQMLDWYPQSCIDYDLQSNITHINLYMFQTIKTKLTINNLQIDLNQYTNLAFGIIGVVNEYKSGVFSSNFVCNYCGFKNIQHHNSDINMIYSTIYITFNHATFTNIVTINPFITMGFESLQITDVNVSDCVFHDSFIRIESTEASYNDGKNDITLSDCIFSNIHSGAAIIDDQWFAADVEISNVHFYDIHNGSIYLGAYESGTAVDIRDITVSTSQIAEDNTVDSLFEFKFADDIYIDSIIVAYTYDTNIWCEYRTETEEDAYYSMDVTYIALACAHPVSLISNFVSMTITNAQLRMNIIEYNDKELINKSDYISLRYSYETKYADYALISNQGELEIYDMIIYGPSFGRRLIYNQDILYIDGLKVIIENDYNPNNLESVSFIKQSRKTSIVTVYNSHFIGTNNQILIASGSAEIYYTIFEDAGGGLQVETAQDIIVSQCNFTRVGRYWSNIEDAMLISQNFPILDLEYVEDTAIIEGNHFFGGFDDVSQSIFIEAADNKHFIVRYNYFMANATDLYYAHPSNNNQVIGMLWFLRNYNVSVYQNNFYKNDINPQIAWLQFESNSANWVDAYRFDSSLPYAPACLSANNFSNYAFHSVYSEITSCFRPGLINCVYFNCTEGHIVGEINTHLHDKTSHFNIDPQYKAHNLSLFTFHLDWSTYRYALDNVQINIIDEYGQKDINESMSLIIYQPNILFIDSIFPSNLNVFYWNATCEVVANDRVDTNTLNHTMDELLIARLEVLCSNWSMSDYNKLELADLDQDPIDYVDHFSATQIHFTSTSSTYYPGQKLKFDYGIADKLDIDIYNISFTDEFILNLANELFGLSQNIKIEAYGICDVCDTGVIMVEVGLNNNYSVSTIDLSVEHGNLALKQDHLRLSIISCPVGYGPDSNEFHCSLCPAGMYNIVPNNTEACESCNEGENKGIQCYEGKVFVKNSYWIGFNIEEEIESHLCPSWYCCNDQSDQKHCNYNIRDQTRLCADGRNASVPLCGACIDGYSQAMNSTKCTECERHHYGYLLVPFILAMCLTLYLIKCHPQKDTDSLEIATQRCCFGVYDFFGVENTAAYQYFMMLVKTFILRNFMYYEQGLSSILWPTSITVYMPYAYSIASLFNLEINIPHDDTQSLWCFYNGLTTKQKILTALIPSLMTTVMLSTMFILIKMCRCLKCQVHCASKHNQNPKIYRCFNTNYGKAFLSLTIICIGQLLSVSFKMLNCRYVASELVHFYFGSEECTFRTFTDILSICFLVVIAITFSIMFIVLTRKTENEREHPNFALNTLCKYYTPQCYWWEFVILLRRVCLSIFAIFYTWFWFPIILIGILLFFLAIHDHYQPFRTSEANHMEYYLISSTIIVISIQTSAMYIDSMRKLASYVLALFIVVPGFVIFAVIIIMLFKMRSNPNRYEMPQYKTYSSTVAQAACEFSDDDDDMINEAPNMHKIHNNQTISGEFIRKAPVYCQPVEVQTAPYGWNNEEDDESVSDDNNKLNTVIELQAHQITNAKDAPYKVLKSLKISDADDPISFTPNAKHLSIDNFSTIATSRKSQFMPTRSIDEDASSPLCKRVTSNQSTSTHL